MDQVAARVPEQHAKRAGRLTEADLRIAVLVPCYNEELTIGNVVKAFRAELPDATVYVYDNNSTDRTLAVATAAGAVCRTEPQQGKGNVVRRMFADIEADIFVMVDGDDTYDATSVRSLIQPVLYQQADMVNAVRVATGKEAYRPGHRFGNAMLTGVLSRTFGDRCTDMLSGYRAMSRRFVKSFPALSEGFEIETEITVHALELGLRIVEITAPYKERPEGSISKLHTYRDGIRILRLILLLLKAERPFRFFAAISAAVFLITAVLAAPLVVTYLETGLVPRLPTAILVTGLSIVGLLTLMSGIILETVTRGRRESKRMQYLSYPALQATQPSQN